MKLRYDVIIIGAGIGGLVCGCYLAKSGMKVLIVEKHDKPGGYCTSFHQEGYSFDVAIHYLGGCKKKGQISRILQELSLSDKLHLTQYDPTDKIVTPDHTVFIRSNSNDTIAGLMKEFPSERDNIDKFFTFLLNKNFYEIYAKTSKITFRNLLGLYFTDFKLKAILSILLGNIGLSDSRASALTAVVLYRDFILNPGFYPEGGMQAFADLLADRFRELGGFLALKTEAVSILTSNKKVSGIIIKNKKHVVSDIVVSNADAQKTFEELLDNKIEECNKRIASLETSISAFAVYIGVKANMGSLIKDKCAIWYFTTYDMDACYGDVMGNMMLDDINYIVCTFPSLHSGDKQKDKGVVELFMGAPFETEDFWELNKEKLAEKAIKKAGKVIPWLAENIDLKVVGTPQTFYQYTYNKHGAMYGWASTPSQIDRSVFPQRTKIEGLYLAGHWCTNGLGQGGISGVAYSGRNIAKIIVNRKSKYDNMVGVNTHE